MLQGYKDTLMANYKLWPMIQFVNFYLVPLNYQLLFLNVIAIGWTAFLSSMNEKSSDNYEILEEFDEEKTKKFQLNKTM